ncbi:MAG: hypothetical protein ABSG91_08645, partial [Syntrophobacteraceae bacterium]
PVVVAGGAKCPPSWSNSNGGIYMGPYLILSGPYKAGSTSGWTATCGGDNIYQNPNDTDLHMNWISNHSITPDVIWVECKKKVAATAAPAQGGAR